MSNPETETDQWDIQGDGQPTTTHTGTHAIQFKKPEPRTTTTTQWTIKDVLGDDLMLKPVAFEMNPEGGSSSNAA